MKYRIMALATAVLAISLLASFSLPIGEVDAGIIKISGNVTPWQGIQGVQGIKGDKGDTGAHGLQGEKGDTGLQGLQGLLGDQGIQGDQGVPGLPGNDGTPGAPGVQGEQGLPGADGAQGEQGIQGEPGPTHNNLTILDSIQEALTTALKTSYDWLVANITTGWKASVEWLVTNVTAAWKYSVDGFMSSTINGHAVSSNYSVTKADVGLNNVPNLDTTNAVNNQHTHSNKTLLDNIQEAFTTALKSSYDWLVTNITSTWKTTVDNFIASKGQANGIAPLDTSGKVPTANLPSMQPLIATGKLSAPVVTSGTGETLLFKLAIPANKVVVGDTFRVWVDGNSSSTGTLIFRVRVGANGTTGDNQAWISATSAAQVANAWAGFEVTVTVRSATSVQASGHGTAGAVVLPQLIGAPATAAIVSTATWYIDIDATCSSGTFTAQNAVITNE